MFARRNIPSCWERWEGSMPTPGMSWATEHSPSRSSSRIRMRAGRARVLKNSAFSWYSGALTSAASPARICAPFPSGAPPLAVLSCRYHARWRPEGVYHQTQQLPILAIGDEGGGVQVSGSCDARHCHDLTGIAGYVMGFIRNLPGLAGAPGGLRAVPACPRAGARADCRAPRRGAEFCIDVVDRKSTRLNSSHLGISYA